MELQSIRPAKRLAVFEGMAVEKRTTAASLAHGRRSLERLLEFARTEYKAELRGISEPIVAEWIQSTRKFGATTPKASRLGLLWCITVLKLPLDTTHAALRAGDRTIGDVVDVRPQPIRGQAKMISADQCRQIERFLTKSSKAVSLASVRVRFGAGLVLFGAYASRRLSCMDRLGPGSLKLTRDAVCAESFKQKNKPSKDSAGTLVFGACRYGLTKIDKTNFFDWGSAFMDARQHYADLLGWATFDSDDFLIPQIKGGQCGPASKTEHRALLKDSLKAAGVKDPQLRWGSLRPLLNTTGAQTSESREDRSLLGNWSPHSGSTDTYDRALGTKELMARMRCMNFHREGGSLGQAFELPQQGPKAKSKRRKRVRSSSSDSSSE